MSAPRRNDLLVVTDSDTSAYVRLKSRCGRSVHLQVFSVAGRMVPPAVSRVNCGAMTRLQLSGDGSDWLVRRRCHAGVTRPS